MADDKPKTITATTKTAMICTNCQRSIAEGETVTTPDNDELNRGNVLCSDCTSQPDPKAARVATAGAATPAPVATLEPAPTPKTTTKSKAT